ncbi:MAG: ABC transporter permease [Betaproteobacteria bacterium]|nr:ABC transporter permease [Betaproteobacteria bacterium]MBL8534656.1 ABC transporter permease [Betaproteobacteria bacterium]
MTRAHVWTVAAPVVVGMALLGLWQFAVTYSDVPAYLVPSPLLIARTLAKDWALLAPALLTTVKIAAIALSLSIATGVATGFLFVQSRAIEASLMPYAVLLQVTPIVAVAPLIIIWVDDPVTALVACATIVALFPMVSSTTLGLKSVDPGLRDLFRLYGASRWQVFLRLRVPSALPYFFSGLRISAGLALIGAVVAEFVAGTGGTSSGLAYQILMAGLQLNIPRMFAALLLIALAGIAFYVLASALAWLALHRWHDSAR